MDDWLALVIGNTRWHWAWFDGLNLIQVWHTPHISPSTLVDRSLRSLLIAQRPQQLIELSPKNLDIWGISVVPDQMQYLQSLRTIQWIEHFPLAETYSTMGLDRMATLWGAGQHYGWPVLVIDAGTALTFTAGAAQTFMGGAILLGLQAHFTALHKRTAALPHVYPPLTRPTLWASDTPSAIHSGVINTMLAGIHQFIESWVDQYPDAKILFTGGDGQYLHQLYQQTYAIKQNQALTNRTWFDENLMFWGVAAYRKEATREV